MTSSPKAPGDPVRRVPFDPRYVFSAVGVTGGRVETHSHYDAIVFPADDPLLPAILAEYLALARRSAGSDPRRIREIEGALRRLAAGHAKTTTTRTRRTR